MNKFLASFLKGIAIGAGAILPGVSGGALAVIFGIYENLTRAIGNIFKNFKKKVLFLMPIGLGAAVGVLALSNILQYLFDNFNVEIRYLFVGLMIGTFPLLFRTANKKGFDKRYIVSFLIALLITIIFALMEDSIKAKASNESPGIFLLILYGFIIGIGTVIPGLSSSVMLIYINAYDIVLKATASIDLKLLIPMGIGFVLCALILTKIISIMFDKAYGWTYYAILGFVIGSIVPIFPGFSLNFRYILSIFIGIVGFCASFYLSRFSEE